ncbi:GNAT family N-acetyltransferase [Lacticaseibacillus parakribbianus]|uniref:GNAT family N-acetyltransferase n=1 Tax=Lacticaseibacillus parakribbianus TaxID=2970927 RepID=UPI0021CB4B36|nr:GNAT family N-acetyltransferase [Lacticaseibacillus parakribbianus]
MNAAGITLRLPTAADTDFFWRYRSDARLAAAEGRPVAATRQAATAFLAKLLAGQAAGTSRTWLITVAEAPVGLIGAWGFDPARTTCELAYGLLPAFQGRGLMTAAVTAVVAQLWHQEPTLVNLDCYTGAANRPSRRLLERLGFALIGQLTEPNQLDQPTEMVQYRRLRPDRLS